MVCLYCKVYQESSIRPEALRRFCYVSRNIVSEHGETCEHFEETKTFWCNKGGEWIDFTICAGRTIKDNSMCKHCSQRKDILSVRKHIGLKNRPRAIIRREVHAQG